MCRGGAECATASVEELTGDSAPDQAALSRADILVTTPEKWDGVSRGWQKRGYVQVGAAPLRQGGGVCA
jgi:replicative superfamily II helicase